MTAFLSIVIDEAETRDPAQAARLEAEGYRLVKTTEESWDGRKWLDTPRKVYHLRRERAQ